MHSVTKSRRRYRGLLLRLAVSSALAAAAILATYPTKAADALSRAELPPDALVQSVSSEVLDSARADLALGKGDSDHLQKVIEAVGPYLDFERMTRLSVGENGWRSATPDQQQALMHEFRTMLLRIYGSALLQVGDHHVSMRAFRARPGDIEVTVRTQVASSVGADPIPLDYRLEKTDAGWKICDVIILGVSLVENFRSSFAREIDQNGVDGLVKSLSDRNRQLATSGGKS
jgi:phospholipid transport system substrate-binding protein